MKTILDIYNEFNRTYTNTNKVLSDSNFLYQNRAQHDDTVFSQDIYSHIIEHCFMRIFLAWENFLEDAFILYLCDSEDIKGNKYKRFAAPNDEEHAYDLLKGTKQYPDWTNLNNINTLSNLFFENSGPFNLLLSNPVEFQHMKTIRNRISHISKQSIKVFNKFTNTQIATNNLTAADFLSTLKDGNGTYYTYYTNIIKSYVEAICNK